MLIQISDQPLDVAGLLRETAHPEAGGVSVFIGNVRQQNERLQKKVIRLEYEAYDAMARKQMELIAHEACARWPVKSWAIAHRVGHLVPGESAVAVIVHTPHRKEAFEACQYMIDELKKRVPIWKKEIFSDGGSWVSNGP